MHDIHAPTKRAALSIIPALKKKGYQLVTVSELAKYRGYKLQKGSIYRRLKKKSGK
jgi:peptidoglycan/xylan/chitin deacetylase (PgdA/CDA1 family)